MSSKRTGWNDNEASPEERKAPLKLDTVWIRTCQECGCEQQSKPPAEYKTDSWRELKCRECKSIALDYGSWKLREH